MSKNLITGRLVYHDKAMIFTHFSLFHLGAFLNGALDLQFSILADFRCVAS